MMLDFLNKNPEKVYNYFIHSSFNIDFYILWLLIKIKEEKKWWKHEYDEQFSDWSPYLAKDVWRKIDHICAILTRLLYFWPVSEVYIKYYTYDEAIDNLKILKEYHLKKENCIDIVENKIWTFTRKNEDSITTNHFHIKLFEKDTQNYIDEYLQNCINDDISDSQHLLYSFEEQLSKVKSELNYNKVSYWKRKFKIDLKAWLLIHEDRINLFTILYFLEEKGYISIHDIYSLSWEFNWKIPSSFLISITEEGMKYLNNSDFIAIWLENKKLLIFYDDMKKELVIDWKRKKLLQKQVIFIEAFFDLKDKQKDWWVSLEEIAIYDDSSFEGKELKEQDNTIKNFYNIWNNLNKSIYLKTGCEKVFELTLGTVRINPIFKS